MRGGRQHLGGGASLHNVALLHHHHAVRVAGHHRQVMADQQHGGAVLARQLQHHLHHLALHHRIQRRGGLVGNQQRRAQQHGRGDHDALAHAARELVREGAQDALGIAQAHALEHRMDARHVLVARLGQVHAQAFEQLLANAQGGRERGHRLLEHHGHARATHSAQLALVHCIERLAVQQDVAATAADGMGREPHHGAAEHGLARARFADDADNLASGQLQGCIAHHQFAGAGREAQILDLQQGRGWGHTRLRMRGSSRSRRASPSRLMPSSASEIASPGKIASQAAWLT